VRALSSTHQQVAGGLDREGAADTLITFFEVAKYQHNLMIPESYPEIDEIRYLGGHSLSDLLAAEKKALAYNLMKAGRPNLTITLPELNAFTVGQLMCLLEVAVVALGTCSMSSG